MVVSPSEVKWYRIRYAAQISAIEQKEETLQQPLSDLTLSSVLPKSLVRRIILQLCLCKVDSSPPLLVQQRGSQRGAATGRAKERPLAALPKLCPITMNPSTDGDSSVQPKSATKLIQELRVALN